MKVLVTGGAGFIGSHLVKRLAGDGDQVTVIDNLSGGRESNLAGVSDRIEFIRGDITGPALEGIVRGKDIVYHLAAVSRVMDSVRDPLLCFRSNVQGTQAVAEACRKSGTGIVFASSREVYGDAERLPVGEDAALMPKNPYAASKVAGEFILSSYGRTYGLKHCILRLANVYGSRDSRRAVPVFIERCLRGEELVVYGGKQVLDMVHVSDAVEAFIKAQSLCGLSINMGSGKGMTIMEIARKIRKAMRSDSEISIRKSRHEEVRAFVADISLARERLGWEPKIEFCRGLKEMIEEKS